MIPSGLLIALGVAALAGVGGWALLRGWGRPARSPWQWTLAAPFCVAHRGGAGLYPENTLAAFEAAVQEHGAPFLELDVHATADGMPVVIHDPTVDRTTGGSGAVRHMTWDALRRLDAAARFVPQAGPGVTAPCPIPTLEEVLGRFPHCWFSVDVKQAEPPCEAGVVAAIRRTGMERRVFVNSAHPAVERRLRRAAPDLLTFYTRRPVVLFWLTHLAGLSRWYRPSHHTLQIPERFGAIPVVTRRFVRSAHRHGIPVIVWTVNAEADMRRLLSLGVDGIMTDRPDLYGKVAAEFAARSPR